MNEAEIYLEIAQRFIESCERHVANGINIQEVIGFKSYHAFESLGGAFNSHFGRTVPAGHTQKINMFVAHSNHNPLINGRNVAIVAMLLSSMRNKYLYPESNSGTFKPPKDQISMTDAVKTVKRVKGILRQIEGII